ncbi:fused MFS/spermidine synthase [Undibacterium sp. Ji50W]|uniref:fused MFS/spermidine synthase n=1 Tax=Undibacterium sp. Ji50W TaxID=3413041 RepID=UPI003BEF650A
MAEKRASLSSLFLNKLSGAELEHMRRLEAIQQAHQGRPFYVDDDNLRMMYLNPKCMQSVMKLDAPNELVCAYSRTVMGFLLFHPRPSHILLIGLGGGSLVKYCYHHLPDCRITALEINADVIAMREQFMLPADDERLHIIQCDAISHLQQHAYAADVILLDAYDENGLVAALNTAEFYANCQRQLATDGVLVANVWGKPSALADMLGRLRQVFKQQVCWSRSEDSYNLIVFAVKGSAIPRAHTGEHPALQLEALAARLLSLDPTTSFEQVDEELHALKQSLAGIMVADNKVPQTYADWKKRVTQQQL